MSNELKIEVGKFYKTRTGKRARIYATDGAGRHRVHGAELFDGEWFPGVWLPNGRWDSAYETRRDLVAEWTDEDAKENEDERIEN